MSDQKKGGPTDERFMRHHYGASGYVPPVQTAPDTSNQQIYNEIHAALCANGLNASVADFLADLAMRVRALESKPGGQAA